VPSAAPQNCCAYGPSCATAAASTAAVSTPRASASACDKWWSSLHPSSGMQAVHVRVASGGPQQRAEELEQMSSK